MMEQAFSEAISPLTALESTSNRSLCDASAASDRQGSHSILNNPRAPR